MAQTTNSSASKQALPKKSSAAKIIWSVVITFVVTALIAGGGIYLWQKSKLDVAYLKLQQQEQAISQLQQQKDSLVASNADLQKQLSDQNEQASNNNQNQAANDAAPAANAQNQAPPAAAGGADANNIDFPVVTYGRKGLLTDHAAGLADLQKLQQKLIDPYTDYNNENSLNLIALRITVPLNVGDPYSVLGIFGGDQQQGSEEFAFGSREQNFDYWHPECMGPCPFTPAFTAKYPQIVNP